MLMISQGLSAQLFSTTRAPIMPVRATLKMHSPLLQTPALVTRIQQEEMKKRRTRVERSKNQNERAELLWAKTFVMLQSCMDIVRDCGSEKLRLHISHHREGIPPSNTQI